MEPKPPTPPAPRHQPHAFEVCTDTGENTSQALARIVTDSTASAATLKVYSDTGESLLAWRTAAQATKLKGRTSVVGQDHITVAIDALGKPVMAPAAHGSFDNDIAVVSRTLERITGAPLAMPVDDLRGY